MSTDRTTTTGRGTFTMIEMWIAYGDAVYRNNGKGWRKVRKDAGTKRKPKA